MDDNLAHVDGLVDLEILDNIVVVLQDSHVFEDQQLADWIKTNYLMKPSLSEDNARPIRNRQGFRNIDRGYRRVRILTSRTQDAWPFYSQSYKKNANAFRKYALGEDQVQIDDLHSTGQTALMTTGTPKIDLSFPGGSGSNVNQEEDVSKELRSATDLHTRDTMADSILSSPRVTSGSSDGIASRIARSTVTAGPMFTAVVADAIPSDLDKHPPGSKETTNHSKRRAEESPAIKGPSMSRSTKRHKSRSTAVGSDEEAIASSITRKNSQKASKNQVSGPASTQANIPKRTFGRRSTQYLINDDDHGSKGQDEISHQKSQKSGYDARAKDNRFYIESNDSETAICPNAEGSGGKLGVPVSPLEMTRVVTSPDHARDPENQSIEHGLNLTIPRGYSDLNSAHGSAVSGVGTTSQRSCSPKPMSATTPATGNALSQDAGEKSIVKDIEFFARIHINQGPLDVQVDEGSMKDIEALKDQLRRYAEFSRSVEGVHTVPFEHFDAIIKYATKQA